MRLTLRKFSLILSPDTRERAAVKLAALRRRSRGERVLHSIKKTCMQSTLHTTTHVTVLPQDEDILYEIVDDKVVELGPMGAHEIWLATVYESPTQVRILTRADELYGEPVLPHFRLPLATLFEDIEAAEPSPQTAS